MYARRCSASRERIFHRELWKKTPTVFARARRPLHDGLISQLCFFSAVCDASPGSGTFPESSRHGGIPFEVDTSSAECLVSLSHILARAQCIIHAAMFNFQFIPVSERRTTPVWSDFVTEHFAVLPARPPRSEPSHEFTYSSEYSAVIPHVRAEQWFGRPWRQSFRMFLRGKKNFSKIPPNRLLQQTTHFRCLHDLRFNVVFVLARSKRCSLNGDWPEDFGRQPTLSSLLEEEDNVGRGKRFNFWRRSSP